MLYFRVRERNNFMFDPLKTGKGKVTTIFWTVNDPPGLQGLKNEKHLKDHGHGFGDSFCRTV